MINTINELDSKFNLMKLFKSGIIPWTILRDRDIYLQFDIYRKMGKSVMDSKEQSALDFKVSIETVHRAVRKMTNEENSNPS